jgi:hypothetical protein
MKTVIISFLNWVIKKLEPDLVKRIAEKTYEGKLVKEQEYQGGCKATYDLPGILEAGQVKHRLERPRFKSEIDQHGSRTGVYIPFLVEFNNGDKIEVERLEKVKKVRCGYCDDAGCVVCASVDVCA